MNAPYYICCSQCSYRGCCGRYKPCSCCGHMNHTNGASVINGSFCEYTSLLQISSGKSYTDNFPTDNANAITIFVKNIGPNPITVSLQNSPNGLDFTDDPQQLELAVSKTGYLVPYIFSRYTRVVAQSTQASTAYIWFQMQNHSYWQHPVRAIPIPPNYGRDRAARPFMAVYRSNTQKGGR